MNNDFVLVSIIKRNKEISQAVERRPRQILKGHDLLGHSARQANLEAAS